ncbi:BTB/POZ domain-containing protein 2-like [Ostrea edulis]|uniref:BTB/POZ domain-containing protein 2-like n=1 Tax=Ostrea edulis TaxID=37623 RepID=UPI0024AF0C1E|nr:BTB/POZ domain-containing protein 2-like [Ostrea edulis]
MAALGNKLIESYRDQLHCDVNIKLKDGTVRALRIVLSLGSDWFRARLSEKWESESNVITCDIHSTDVTKFMIEYLYISQIEISVENIEEIYQIADYYGVKGLIEECILFLQESISIKNSLKILTIAHNNQIATIKAQCLQFVDLHLEDILGLVAEDFLDIPYGLLMDIITRDSLSIHEELLFRNIDMWISTIREEERKGILWKEVIPHVRFGRMSMDFFLDQIATIAILEDAFSLQVMRHLSTLDDTLPLRYIKKRQSITCNDIVVHRFMNCSSESTWLVDNTLNGDRISFSINSENMKLKGLVVYGRIEARGIFSAMIYTENGQTLLVKTQSKEQCTNYSSIHLLFPTPLLLLRDAVYTVVLKVIGGPTSYGVGGLSSTSVVLGENNTLTVKFSGAGCGHTNVHTGQIKRLIFKQV